MKNRFKYYIWCFNYKDAQQFKDHSAFPLIIPIQTKPIPTTMLIAMYKRLNPVFWFSSSLTFSKPKAENVVYPPQKPVTKNHFKSECKRFCFWKNDRIKPIKKHPVMLTSNVAKGNTECQYLLTKIVVKNRKTLPNAPPTAIKTIVLNITCKFYQHNNTVLI